MTRYRLWPSTNGAGSLGGSSPITLGTEFYVTQRAWVVALHYYRTDTNVGVADDMEVYQVGVNPVALGPNSGTYSGPATGWRKLSDFPLIELTANQKYRVALYQADGNIANTDNYWSTGAGSAGITNGILVAPNATDAFENAQGSFKAGTGIQYPSDTNTAKSCYWVDVEVTDSAFVDVGQAVETDTAFSITPSKRRSVAQAAETDTAQAVVASKARTLSQATESNTANSIPPAKQHALGRATESGTAGLMVPVKSNVNQAVESDTAGTITAQMIGPWRLIAPILHEKLVHKGLRIPRHTALTVYGDDDGLVAEDVPATEDLEGKKYVFVGGYEHTTEDPALKSLWMSSGFEVRSA
jgi:hypothetical protein